MPKATNKRTGALLATIMAVAFTLHAGRARAQNPAAAAAAAQLLPGAVVRRVVMKDAVSAEQLRAKLEQMKAAGLFRDQLPGTDPKNPANIIEISFLVSGNYLLVVGGKKWVDSNIESIRLMAYLFERPRAHLQLSLRVVQITGPANASVIQMSETVRALVDSAREEVVRTFADLDDLLTSRVKERMGEDAKLQDTVRQLLPTLGTGERPLSVPEILLLLMLDRTSPAPPSDAQGERGEADPQSVLLDLSRVLMNVVQDPRQDEAAVLTDIQDELAAWKRVVANARDWCHRYVNELNGGKGPGGLATLKQALAQPDLPIPMWVARRLSRSLALTERLYPNLARKHTVQSLQELERRFDTALARANKIEQAIARGDAGRAEPAPGGDGESLEGKAAPAEGAAGEDKGDKEDSLESPAGRSQAAKKPKNPSVPGRRAQNILALKTLADQMVPSPMALFEQVAATADNSAPTPEQLIGMFKEFSTERRKLDERLGADDPSKLGEINYAKLQTLEATLNLWLRRVSEAMARALEQQFYRRYVNELQVLANKELGRTSNRDLLAETSLDEVPDLARDLLLADTGVNVFVSNSVSLQFAPDTMNSVSAQVQSSLPSKLTMQERIAQAETANRSFGTMAQTLGFNGESVVKALLAGGQAVPVQGGMSLAAMPSIGIDASTVTLSITANQTLAPNTDKVADRVTNHSINNATVTALTYEPMVLSTLASNVSYFETEGGIPILRKTPLVNKMLKDIPFAPFKESRRQKGVYQSSVIILEPVVIPTIEDLVRFHAGWRDDEAPMPAAAAAPAPAAPAAPAPGK